MKNKKQMTKTSLKKRMNSTAILAFYKARAIKGDRIRLSNETGYSYSHILNVEAGRRRIPTVLADAMYSISRRRVKQEVNC